MKPFPGTGDDWDRLLLTCIQGMQGLDSDVLDAFPAQELVNCSDEMRARWDHLGDRFIADRMVGLKSDSVWQRVSDFELPFPPFISEDSTSPRRCRPRRSGPVPILGTAKVWILAASAISGVAGAIILLRGTKADANIARQNKEKCLAGDNLRMKSTLLSRVIFRFLLGTILFSVSALLAGAPVEDAKSTASLETQSWYEAPPPLEVRIGIPGWLSGLSGDFGVRGIVSPLDVEFQDLLNRLDNIPVVLSACVRYYRWEFFGDGQYLKLPDSVRLPGVLFDRADITVKSALIESFAGYRLVNCEKVSLSLFAGARYNYMNGELHIFDYGDPRFPINHLGIPSGQTKT